MLTLFLYLIKVEILLTLMIFQLSWRNTRSRIELSTALIAKEILAHNNQPSSQKFVNRKCLREILVHIRYEPSDRLYNATEISIPKLTLSHT